MKQASNAAILFVVLLVTIPGLCWAGPAETTIAGRLVSVSLVKADDLSPTPWPDDSFQLTTQTVAVQSKDSIFDLLVANGIEPDVEAFTVVYDLNPSLLQIDPLPSGVNLVLPKIVGGDRLRDELLHGHLVMLTVDSGLRRELATSASELQDLSTRFARIPADRFAGSSAREEMESNVTILADWFTYAQRTFLQRTGPPLRRQTLMGMRDEALALNSLLSATIATQQKVSPDDQEQVMAIYKDIQSQIRKYDNVMAGEPPPGESEYKVVVTIHGPDAKVIQGLQVYWAYQGLFRKPPKEPLSSQPFDGVGSGSSATLTTADYVVWAGTPGHPFPPATDQKPISVGPIGGSPRQIVLSISQ